MSRVRRRGDGLRVTLRSEEVAVLRGLARELREVLDAPSGDPALDRLFPTAYLDPTEEDAEAQWQEMVRPGLLEGRLAAIGAVDAALDGEGAEVTVVLGPDDVPAWMGLLNDLRLTLGVRLEITESLDWGAIRRDDPNADAYAVYEWLTHLQGSLLGALGYD